MCSANFENRALYELMWKKCVERVRPQMTMWGTRIACWITKATITHLQNVTPIVFPQQQQLHEGATMLLNTYFACLVDHISFSSS
jgi:hypothetical protein